MKDKLFTIDSIRRVTKLLPDGTFAELMEVRFTTKSNITSIIEVPVEHFDVDTVKEMVTREAQKIEQIMAL